MFESQIASIINQAYDGVERSKLGPILEKTADGKKQLNHVPFQAFLTILNNLTPKNFDMTLTDEE